MAGAECTVSSEVISIAQEGSSYSIYHMLHWDMEEYLCMKQTLRFPTFFPTCSFYTVWNLGLHVHTIQTYIATVL